jgi:cholesterol oxidase
VTAGDEVDVVVIGSGFGGSTSALRLTEKGYRVAVLEAGRRFDESTLPRTSWRVRSFLWAPKLGCFGIQRISLIKDVMVLAGAGVGGGSLNYANTLYEPLAPFYADPAVGAHHRLASGAGPVLRPGQAHARRGGEPHPHPGRRDHAGGG